MPFVRQAEIYGWLTVVAGTGEGSRRHEDRLITARRPADLGGTTAWCCAGRGTQSRLICAPGRWVVHAPAGEVATRGRVPSCDAVTRKGPPVGRLLPCLRDVADVEAVAGDELGGEVAVEGDAVFGLDSEGLLW